MESMSTHPVSLRLCLVLTGLLGTVSAHAVDAGYVDAVQADVAEFSTGEFQAPDGSSWLGAADSEAAQMADLATFSSFLQNKSPGSFIFYRKLPTVYKERLHKDYLATGDLERIKQDIFKYTREAKR